MVSCHVEKYNVIGGVVEISEDSRLLRVERGFLIIEEKDSERRSILARIDLDQFDTLILSNHGAFISTPLIHNLIERNKSIVLCGKDFMPYSFIYPISGNYESAKRIISQTKTTKPLLKRLWQKIVQEKIRNQATVLKLTNNMEAFQKLDLLANRVLSGDPDNKEAQASRIYWPALMGKDFRRGDDEDIRNHYFNYAYTLTRSAFCRAIAAFGLLPVFGLHHINQHNFFVLADDLMEPFRPFLDFYVVNQIRDLSCSISPETKKILCRVLITNVDFNGQKTILTNSIYGMVSSLLKCYENKKPELCMPNLFKNVAPLTTSI
jgi:CRISPR-associated protein Cas1